MPYQQGGIGSRFPSRCLCQPSAAGHRSRIEPLLSATPGSFVSQPAELPLHPEGRTQDRTQSSTRHSRGASDRSSPPAAGSSSSCSTCLLPRPHVFNSYRVWHCPTKTNSVTKDGPGGREGGEGGAAPPAQLSCPQCPSPGALAIRCRLNSAAVPVRGGRIPPTGSGTAAPHNTPEGSDPQSRTTPHSPTAPQPPSPQSPRSTAARPCSLTTAPKHEQPVLPARRSPGVLNTPRVYVAARTMSAFLGRAHLCRERGGEGGEVTLSCPPQAVSYPERFKSASPHPPRNSVCPLGVPGADH